MTVPQTPPPEGDSPKSPPSGQNVKAKPSAKHSPRRLARLRAVQLLYQMEMTKTAPDQAMTMMVEQSGGTNGKKPGRVDEKFFRHLLAASAIEPVALDRLIVAALPPSWPLERLDSVLRALLRIAVVELKANPEIPPLVTISEYVAIAHAFFGGKEPSLVNGLLHHLAQQIRPAEMPTDLDAAPQSEHEV